MRELISSIPKSIRTQLQAIRHRYEVPGDADVMEGVSLQYTRVVPGISRDPGMISMREGSAPGSVTPLYSTLFAIVFMFHGKKEDDLDRFR